MCPGWEIVAMVCGSCSFLFASNNWIVANFGFELTSTAAIDTNLSQQTEHVSLFQKHQ